MTRQRPAERADAKWWPERRISGPIKEQNPVLHLLYASIARVLSYPAAWVGLLGIALAGPGIGSAMDYGILSNDILYGSNLASSVFLGALWGSALACAALGRQAWLLSQGDRAQRVAIEGLTLLSATMLFGFAGLIALACLRPGPTVASGLILGAFLCCAHWSALGLVAVRLPVPPAARVLVLPALGWWLPAAVEPSSSLVARAMRLLDPSSALAGLHGSAETLPGILADTAAIGSLVLLANLLPTSAADR